MSNHESMGGYKPYEPDQPYGEMDAYMRAVGIAIARLGSQAQEPTNNPEAGTASPFDHDNDEWIEKLTVPPQELSPFERNAIAQHVAVCPDCCGVIGDFATLGRLLDMLPAPKITQGLPPRLLELWRQQDEESKRRNSALPPDEPQL